MKSAIAASFRSESDYFKDLLDYALYYLFIINGFYISKTYTTFNLTFLHNPINVEHGCSHAFFRSIKLNFGCRCKANGGSTAYG